MRNKFTYSPPRALNNLTYASLSAVICLFIYLPDSTWWLNYTSETTFFDFMVLKGFLFYITLFWAVGIPYLLLDKYKKPHFLYKYKIQKNDKQDTYEKQRKKLPKTIKRVLQNQFFGTLPALVFLYIYLAYSGYNWAAPLPNFATLIGHFVLLLLGEELCFFTVHRIMHTKYLYRKIHKIHHEYAESIGIATHYVHYLEHIFGNLLPFFFGLIVFHVHILPFCLWATIGTINAIHSHSGYNFPWASYTLYHEHHHYNFTGNYGILGYLDRLFKTDLDFKKIQQNP